jgi:prolyl oligopeptidase
LITKKITSPKHLGAMGGSNGGLLMGVCYTQRPDLFAAINCGVPLLDMHRYHQLLAGASWMAEYGDPDDETDGAYIRKISPYQNIKEGTKYPVMFLNTSTKDDRVHPGHARKFAAKLKEYQHPVYYYENIDGGHAGASNYKESAFLHALDMCFFWTHLV